MVVLNKHPFKTGSLEFQESLVHFSSGFEAPPKKKLVAFGYVLVVHGSSPSWICFDVLRIRGPMRFIIIFHYHVKGSNVWKQISRILVV